jgi:SAM-dependent methyltransferase
MAPAKCRAEDGIVRSGGPMTDVQPLGRTQCATAELLNLGAGTGRWLLQEARRLGVGHPLGIDINRAKVARAQASGLPVYEADFTKLDPQEFPSVKVVVFDNVLEHLPSLASVEVMFERACAIASHVVYIRHPSFEHEQYLASVGLKQYWTDWPGVHTAHVRLHEFAAIAARSGVYDLTIRPLKRARGSDDPTILPASAPPNQRKTARGPGTYGVYDEAMHGRKESIEFDRPVYFGFDLFFFLRADAPTVQYHADTDDEVAHPFLVWTDRNRGRSRARFPRRARRLLTMATERKR